MSRLLTRRGRQRTRGAAPTFVEPCKAFLGKTGGPLSADGVALLDADPHDGVAARLATEISTAMLNALPDRQT